MFVLGSLSYLTDSSGSGSRNNVVMAGVSWAWRARFLLVAVTVMVPVPASSQTPPRKSIANPDFPCGVPWGPNGERPTETSRSKRQIIFPSDNNYKYYLGLLKRKDGTIDSRDKDPSGEGQDPLEDTFCGASVISDRFLITAAHCALSETNPISSVRLGDIDLTSENEANSRPADYDIMEIILHPGYRGNTTVRYNDVALLLTYDTIQFNDVVFPYCIPAEPPAPGTIVTASGFGLYNATTQSSHVLEANFTIMDTKECEDIYIREDLEAQLRVRYPGLLQGTDMICAIDDVSDACQGDSGGPVILKKDGKEYLTGIVAGGASCRGNFRSELPGIYLSLAKHVNFISSVVYGPVPPPEPL